MFLISFFLLHIVVQNGVASLTLVKYVKSQNVVTGLNALADVTHTEQCLMLCSKDPSCVTASYRPSTGSCEGSLSIPGGSINTDSGYVTYVKEFMYIGSSALSWEDSKTFCTSKGYYLMEIYSQEENDFIFRYLKDRSISYVWIGVNDKLEENRFVWNEKTTEIPYDHFGSTQPNGGTAHNCVNLSSSQGYWYDNHCNKVFHRPLCRTI